jgi:hypothetical protein
MTEFSQDDHPQATPGTEGAIAPAPAELQIGVGALLARLTADEDAA